MPSSRLTLLALRPGPQSVRPAGHHLRWFFPRELGVPPDGFRIFRRPSELKPRTAVDFSTLPPHTARSATTSTGTASLKLDSDPLGSLLRLLGQLPARGQLRSGDVDQVRFAGHRTHPVRYRVDLAFEQLNPELVMRHQSDGHFEARR